MAAKASGTRSDRKKVIEKLKFNWKKWLKRVLVAIAALVVLFLAMVAFAYFSASWAARGKLYDEVSELPNVKVGLVFGTTDRLQGRENRYFRYRIDAAAEVWKAGKVEILIVSGDNRSRYYNEPEKMRVALIAAGVPEEKIVCDYAGLRTLDSVVRAKKVFGTDKVLVISQKFQNQRAIYLAKAHKMKAYGFNARDVGFKAGFKTQVREIGARVKMWLDVNFLDTKPTHLGDKVPLPE